MLGQENTCDIPSKPSIGTELTRRWCLVVVEGTEEGTVSDGEPPNTSGGKWLLVSTLCTGVWMQWDGRSKTQGG